MGRGAAVAASGCGADGVHGGELRAWSWPEDDRWCPYARQRASAPNEAVGTDARLILDRKYYDHRSTNDQNMQVSTRTIGLAPCRTGTAAGGRWRVRLCVNGAGRRRHDPGSVIEEVGTGRGGVEYGNRGAVSSVRTGSCRGAMAEMERRRRRGARGEGGGPGRSRGTDARWRPASARGRPPRVGRATTEGGITKAPAGDAGGGFGTDSVT